MGGTTTVLAARYGLVDWKTAAPLRPTDGPWSDGARLGTYADGAWLPDWAKRFSQPALVARALKVASDSFPAASAKVPPGSLASGRTRSNRTARGVSTGDRGAPLEDAVDQIRRLAELRDEGLLTEDEFQTKD